jgi:hypothetical protein
MAVGHEITGEEALPTLDGYGYIVRCSCTGLFEQAPIPGMSADQAKTLAHEKWKLHLSGL